MRTWPSTKAKYPEDQTIANQRDSLFFNEISATDTEFPILPFLAQNACRPPTAAVKHTVNSAHCDAERGAEGEREPPN